MSTPVESCPEIKLSMADDDDGDRDKRVKMMQRAQWLRAAILGANDGLLSTTSLMLGVGAAKEDQRLMIIAGLAGALSGPAAWPSVSSCPFPLRETLKFRLLTNATRELSIRRVVVIVVVTSIALAVFGSRGPAWRFAVRASAVRVLVGGWISMAVTYGLLKPLDRDYKGVEDSD
ncbi:hypothetical protein DH2020_038697 [Rehmannia glutinosa]|uniref:Vacuolar iron transporter n=1 Tax=Rehmannia glutinosa TaxID=99300 RepID=A0ABR0UXU8_REHGL